jgi:hypothetical protein
MVFAGAREFYERHRRWQPIAFFVLGFLFDAAVLHRIDELSVLIQQALYIILCGTFIGVELVEQVREVHPPFLLRRVWKYREGLLHFMLGTLLNSYTIFYFKSASALTSFFFILLLIALLTMNEFKRFGKSQTQVHMAFLSLCLISYFVALAPIVLGFIGAIPFLVANVAAVAIYLGFSHAMNPRLSPIPGLFQSHVLKPFAAVQVGFMVLYFLRLIPPVPLSVTYLGIYHDVQKKGGEYELTYTRSRWRFWENGDQTFSARVGDAVYCFVQVFSPSRFKDELQVRWLYQDPKLGWQASDAIPLPIVGGREEGYRGVTKKNNFAPGDWRVQIETRDGREVGRITFTIELDESTSERELKFDRK